MIHDPDYPDVDPVTGDEAETIDRLEAAVVARDGVIARLQRAARLEARLRRRRRER